LEFGASLDVGTWSLELPKKVVIFGSLPNFRGPDAERVRMICPPVRPLPDDSANEVEQIDNKTTVR
jgi:hypothetical protein